MAGVGGAGSSGGGASSGAGSNSNSSSSAGKNDSNKNDSSKNDKSSKSSGSDKSESKSSKGSGSERGSFDRAMSDAQNKADGGNDNQNKTEAEQQSDKTAPSTSRERVSHFSGLSRSKDMQQASRQHANEFSGLGPTGNASLNSHRGYGPDETMAGGIDQDVNAAQEQQSKTSSFDRSKGLDWAGYGAAGAGAGFGVKAQHENLKGLNTVADKLDKAPTKNLPAHPDFSGKMGDYAESLREQKSAKGALKNLPQYNGGVIRDTLEDAAKIAGKHNLVSHGIGLAFDPAITATTTAVTTEGDWTEKATAAIIEGAKRVDNAVVSWGSGFVAATVTTGATAGTGTLAAPAVGLTAGIAAGEIYSRTPADPMFNEAVESLRPTVQASLDVVDQFVDNHVEAAQGALNFIGETWNDISETLSDEDNRSADLDPNSAP